MLMRFQRNQVQRSVRRVGARLRLYALLVAVLVPGSGIAGSYVPGEVETALLTIGRQDDVRAFAAGPYATALAPGRP